MRRYMRIESLEDQTATIYDKGLGVEYDFAKRDGRVTCEIHPLREGGMLILKQIFKVLVFDAQIIGGSEEASYLGETFCVSIEKLKPFKIIRSFLPSIREQVKSSGVKCGKYGALTMNMME